MTIQDLTACLYTTDVRTVQSFSECRVYPHEILIFSIHVNFYTITRIYPAGIKMYLDLRNGSTTDVHTMVTRTAIKRFAELPESEANPSVEYCCGSGCLSCHDDRIEFAIYKSVNGPRGNRTRAPFSMMNRTLISASLHQRRQNGSSVKEFAHDLSTTLVTGRRAKT